MATYEILKPYAMMADPKDAARVSAARAARYKANKLRFLKRLRPMNCLPSFLIRTLHDYVSGEAEFSRYQRILIDGWNQSGLRRPAAGRALARLYSLGPELFSHLDKGYFSGPTRSLDKRFIVDTARLDWSKIFASEDMLSPHRLEEALRTASTEKLTKREQDFVRGIVQTNKKRTWRAFAKDPQAAASMRSTVEQPVAPYYIADRASGRALRLSERDFRIADARSPYSGKEITGKALEEFFIREEDEPKQLACFDWWLYRLGHKIDEHEETFGDDPVFVYSAFVLSETAPPELIAGPEVYKPRADEIHSNFRRSYKRIHPAPGGHPSQRGNLFYGNESLMLVVDAIEDDQYFSDDTAGYVDFGFRVAGMISSLDPTGITSILVAVGELVWAVVRFFDWLDDNDYVGRSMYHLHPNFLPRELDAYPWSKDWDLRFNKDGHMWRFRIRSQVKGATFL